MKANLLLVLLVWFTFFISCSDKNNEEQPSNGKTILLVNKSQQDYEAIKSNTADVQNDPFVLNEIYYEDGAIKLTVSYSGGCRTHAFTITWDEIIKYSYPPIINLIITHDANGDMCEAYITETLAFQTDLLFDSITIQNLSVAAFNGSTLQDSLTYINEPTIFEFHESDKCEIEVTASRVICGNGLFGNLWFALEDSTTAGDTTQCSRFLQPVEVSGNISGFTPEEGKKYRIGARLQENHPFSDEGVCRAYSGPFVPVLITCVKEAK